MHNGFAWTTFRFPGGASAYLTADASLLHEQHGCHRGALKPSRLSALFKLPVQAATEKLTLMAAPKAKKHSKKQQSNGTGSHQQPTGKGNNLQGEVAEFASSLGLASGGSQQGFDDSDFRPEKAQKRFKASARTDAAPCYLTHLASSKTRSLRAQVDTARGTRQQSHGKRPQQDASRPPAEQALGQSPHAPRSLGSRQKQGNWAGKGAAEATGAPPKPRTSREEQNLDSVKGRTWNTGVGPRPGGPCPCHGC